MYLTKLFKRNTRFTRKVSQYADIQPYTGRKNKKAYVSAELVTQVCLYVIFVSQLRTLEYNMESEYKYVLRIFKFCKGRPKTSELEVNMYKVQRNGKYSQTKRSRQLELEVRKQTLYLASSPSSSPSNTSGEFYKEYNRIKPKRYHSF